MESKNSFPWDKRLSNLDTPHAKLDTKEKAPKYGETSFPGDGAAHGHDAKDIKPSTTASSGGRETDRQAERESNTKQHNYKN